jgi:thiaminase
MSESDWIVLIIWAMGATGAWLLGYWYGIRSLRNRNKKVIDAIQENNKIYGEWVETHEGHNYEAGYAAGIANTLDTLTDFLDKAS